MARHYITNMSLLHSKYGGYDVKYCNVFFGCEHWMQFKDSGIFTQFLK